MICQSEQFITSLGQILSQIGIKQITTRTDLKIEIMFDDGSVFEFDTIYLDQLGRATIIP